MMEPPIPHSVAGSKMRAMLKEDREKKARMDTLKPKQVLGLRKLLQKELFTTLSTKDIKPE